MANRKSKSGKGKSGSTAGKLNAKTLRPTLFGRADYDHLTGIWSNVKIDNDFTFFCEGYTAKIEQQGPVAGKPVGDSDHDRRQSASSDEEFSTRLPALGMPAGGKSRKPPSSKKASTIKIRGRCLFCRCRFLKTNPLRAVQGTSVTIRADAKSIESAESALETFLNQSDQGDPTALLQALREESWIVRMNKETNSPISVSEEQRVDVLLSKSPYQGKRDFNPPNTCSIKSIAQLLFGEVFLHQPREQEKRTAPSLESMHGAILIAGQTKSAKSLITRALIHQMFSHHPTYQFLRVQRDRNPHLLTCEDPVEQWFHKPLESATEPQLTDIIDYTARDKNASDYRSLTKVFEDALRQTPACMLVGETRKQDDLKQLIDFAGTGHLVVTTLHAGSLQDVFTKVFEATRVETSSKRGLIGKRILAAIHLKQISFSDDDGTWNAVIPSLWRRTPASTSALVASGIGSLTPHVDYRHDCLGRQFFARELMKQAGHRVEQSVKDRLIAEALNLDLQGE